MTIRYLKVEVTRELATDVYLMIDDADPMFAPMVTQPYPELPAMLVLTPELRKAAEKAVAEFRYETDWEDNGPYASGTADEVTEKEAREYAPLWDANAGKVEEPK